MHPLLPQVSSHPFPYPPLSILVPLAYAGSKPPQTLTSLYRAVLGWSVPPDAYMIPYERLDFVIITALFGVFVGATTAFSVLSAEWLVSPSLSIPTQLHKLTPSSNPWDIPTRPLG